MKTIIYTLLEHTKWAALAFSLGSMGLSDVIKQMPTTAGEEVLHNVGLPEPPPPPPSR